ncbi:hypothetical protein K504DRAFT_12696 [Pleomassaria siparia CBS 279.74]|uniref:Uncharacterized protein n=1 Tax=Pleomassaria siparia CBS 279.74 TaxID=1314801 RepID=A0A6G1KPU1_9PLEO|nr:hypothetical protein K504DRAFT_12696 [Pleomassaria siparia CBS 279.74]
MRTRVFFSQWFSYPGLPFIDNIAVTYMANTRHSPSLIKCYKHPSYRKSGRLIPISTRLETAEHSVTRINHNAIFGQRSTFMPRYPISNIHALLSPFASNLPLFPNRWLLHIGMRWPVAQREISCGRYHCYHGRRRWLMIQDEETPMSYRERTTTSSSPPPEFLYHESDYTNALLWAYPLYDNHQTPTRAESNTNNLGSVWFGMKSLYGTIL